MKLWMCVIKAPASAAASMVVRSEDGPAVHLLCSQEARHCLSMVACARHQELERCPTSPSAWMLLWARGAGVATALLKCHRHSHHRLRHLWNGFREQP